MKSITLKAYAKINIGLDITGKRPDGYHLLKSCMQTVDLYDVITVTAKESLKEDEIIITSDNAQIPKDETNIAARATRKIKEKYDISGGILIDIQKNIPMEAGLAGGSTDGGAVIKAMDRLFGLNMSPLQKDEIALELGADVPFCLRRGLWLCEGIGEKLHHLPDLKDIFCVIIKPDFSVSTAWCYKEYDALKRVVHPDMDAFTDGVKAGNLSLVFANAGNVLEQVVCPAYKEIETLKKMLYKNGASLALMTGSGSAVFGLFTEKKKACDAYISLKDSLPVCFFAELISDEKEEI